MISFYTHEWISILMTYQHENCIGNWMSDNGIYHFTQYMMVHTGYTWLIISNSRSRYCIRIYWTIAYQRLKNEILLVVPFKLIIQTWIIH